MTIQKSMLSPADDYLIHQTPEVIRHVFTSDRRFYDRHFWVGHANNGEAFFLAGMGAYPNLGVIDGFFSISVGDTQITVRGSRELGTDRTDTANVGPFSLTMIEGLKSFRLTCAETEGVAFDLTWINSAPAFEEPPMFHRLGGRVMEQGQRFVQSGFWAGHIVVDGKRFDVTNQSWWGSRDHSWGVRATGFEHEPKGLVDKIGAGENLTNLWLWAPMQFPDASLHLIILERGHRRAIAAARWMDTKGQDDIVLMGDPQQHLQFDAEEKRLVGGTLTYRDQEDRLRTITVQPLRQAYLTAATGYFGSTEAGAADDWFHGKYMGPSWTSVRRFDLSTPAGRAAVGISLSHNLCRLTRDSGEVGFADVEVLIR